MTATPPPAAPAARWIRAHKALSAGAFAAVVLVAGAVAGDQPEPARVTTAPPAERPATPTRAATSAPPSPRPSPTPTPRATTARPVAPPPAMASPSRKPSPMPTVRRTAAPPPVRPANCDPSYPDVCIPPRPPDLDCDEVPYEDFRVVGGDPHGFDRDDDGVGCES